MLPIINFLVNILFGLCMARKTNMNEAFLHSGSRNKSERFSNCTDGQ